MKYLLFFLLPLMLSCSSTTNSNIQTASTIYQNSDTDVPSQWVIRIEPKYPSDAFEQGLEGFVKFEAVIDENGKLENIEIIESNPLGVFDEEGLRALKYWLFKPAVKGGKTVKTAYTDKLVWQLEK